MSEASKTNTSYHYYDDILHADEFDKNLIKIN